MVEPLPLDRRSSPAAVAAGLAALVVAAYAVLLSSPFGWSDDFKFFLLQGDLPLQRFPAIDHGRPLLWPSFDLVLPDDARFGAMVRFRVLFLVGIAAAVVAFFAVLFRLWRDRLLAASAAALCFLSPPWVDAPMMGANSWLPLVAVLTIAAFACHLRALSRWPSSKAAALAWWTGTALLLGVGGSHHQSPLFLWVALAVARALYPLSSLSRSVRSLIVDGSALAAGLVPYAVLAWVALPRFLDFPVAERSGLTDEPLLKLVWFVALPLRDALALPVIFDHDAFFHPLTQAPERAIHAGRVLELAADPAYWTAGVVGAALAFGLWRYLAPMRGRAILALGLASTLPASMALNVVIASRWAPFRTQSGLVGIVAVLAAVSGVTLLRRRGWSPAAQRNVCLALILVAAAVTARNTAVYVVAPLACEWRALLADVEDTRDHEVIVVRMAYAGATPAPGVRYEVGRPAGAADWAPEAMVRVARRELGLDDGVPVSVLPPDRAVPPLPPGTGFVQLGCPLSAEGASAPGGPALKDRPLPASSSPGLAGEDGR